MKKKAIATIILNTISGVRNLKANNIKETGRQQVLFNFSYIAFIQKNNCLTNS